MSGSPDPVGQANFFVWLCGWKLFYYAELSYHVIDCPQHGSQFLKSLTGFPEVDA